MNKSSKETMQKYLKFQYWTTYLRTQGVLSEQDYHRMLTMIRVKCGIP